MNLSLRKGHTNVPCTIFIFVIIFKLKLFPDKKLTVLLFWDRVHETISLSSNLNHLPSFLWTPIALYYFVSVFLIFAYSLVLLLLLRCFGLIWVWKTVSHLLKCMLSPRRALCNSHVPNRILAQSKCSASSGETSGQDLASHLCSITQLLCEFEQIHTHLWGL